MRNVLLLMIAGLAVAASGGECRWTGVAQNGVWTDAANWEGGVPTASDAANLAGAVVSVSWTDFACSSVTLGGGELVLAVPRQTSGDLNVPVTGEGTFCKAGEGTLRLTAPVFAGGPALIVDDGELDLNGTAQAVASVFGGGVVTNSAPAAATLTVSSDGEASLLAKVTGNVRLVKAGPGTLRVGGGQAHSGDTVVLEGRLCAVTNVAVESIDGCVVHLDASRADTLDIDGAGRVRAWRSTAGDGLVFTRPAASPVYPTDLPLYCEKGVGGQLPCVRFGFTDATEAAHTLTFLSAARPVSHRTLVFVTMPKTGDPAYACFTPYGYPFVDATMGGEQTRICLRAGYVTAAGALYGTQGVKWNGGNPYQYLNGQCRWTPEGGVDATTSFNFHVDGAARPHVITVVLPEGAPSVDFPPSVGCGRIHWNGMTRNKDGSYRVTDWFTGSLCEVLVFDRTLGDDERARIETALTSKWSLTHKGDKSVETAFSANSTVRASGVNVLDLGGLSAKIGGLAIAAGSSYVFDVPAEDRQTLEVGRLSGPGTLEKRGEGTLKLCVRTEIVESPATLHVDDGVLDLDGGYLTASSVRGGGVITNSAMTLATLRVDAPDDAVLLPSVRGDVTVVKAGDGRLAVGGWQAYSGDTELSAGTLTTVTNVAVESIDGCVVHLDASRADTLDIDGAGRVRAWRSTAGDGLVFTRPAASPVYPTDLPLYCEKGVGGQLPCVRFGFTDATEAAHTLTFLSAARPVSHRTLVFVTMPKTGDPAYACFTPYGYPFVDATMGGEQTRICLRAGYVTAAGALYGTQGVKWNGGNPYQYLNGQCRWTPEGGVDATTSFNFHVDGAARPHVITVVLPEGAPSVDFPPSVGCGRIHWNGMTRNKDGSYRVTDWFTGSLCEVLVFDRTLGDDERARIETALMAKWSLTHKGDRTFENPLSPHAGLKVSGSARLEPGDAPWSLRRLTIDGGFGPTLPLLTYVGAFEATDVALSFERLAEGAKGTFVTATEARIGKFGSVSGLVAGQRIAYRPRGARVSAGGGLVVIR